MLYRSWISIFCEETYQHNPNCPLFGHADYSRTIAARFTIYNRFMGLCIQAGWQSSRRGGWVSIALLLQYRAVISRDSGAFAILELADLQACSIRNSEDLSDLLVNTSIKIRRSFGKSANPYDENKNGESLLFECMLTTYTINVLTGDRDP